MLFHFKIPFLSLPISKGTVFSWKNCPVSHSDIKEMSKLPYRSVLCFISFVARHTRPDPSNALHVLSQFQSNSGISHWGGSLRLAYLRSTRHYQLRPSCESNKLGIYSDATSTLTETTEV